MDKFFAFIKKYYLSIWVRNSIFISLFIIINIIINSITIAEKRENFSGVIISLVGSFILVFIHNHFLLRLYLFQKKIIKYLLLFIVYLTVVTLFVAYIVPFFKKFNDEINIPYIIVSIFSDTLLSSILYFLHFYFLKYIKMNEIEILNHKTEIENLKQQLNPHFLLNSLNNLYGVSLSNPTEVPSKIIELTDLLKYQIETSKKQYNSLEVEKEFIEKYISYSKWKLQNIIINSTQIGELKNYKITPMLFLPLVENAIKYSNFDKNPIISIHWEFNVSKFTFTITNNFADNKNEHFSTKTGLKNLRKRLELFHVDSNLEIEEKNNNYKVTLSLWNLTTIA